MGDWETTAKMFTGLIDKPKMTEKLLSKPPFKYLFDIIMETSKKTGFAKGLYQGNEASGDHYKDRDTKIAFLTKIIQLTEMMTGSGVNAKPQKIVAGLEPENTNALLQEIFKLATNKDVSSDPYVNKILGGGGAEAEEDEEEVRKKEPEKKKIERPPSAARVKKIPEPASKKAVEEEEPPRQEAKKSSEKPKKEEYSKNVQKLMDEGEEEAAQQKATEKKEEEQPVESKNKLGNLRKKKKGDKAGVDRVISSTGELNEKELEMLQTMIQTICQNTAPLGKSIEFINDDVDSMNKELQFWRKQYNASKIKMQSELKVTEESLLPVYDKIAEIEDQIKDQKGKIQNAKAQIIKNDSTIKDLLMSVVTTK